MTDLEREILDFEGEWWQARGNKEAEIARRFGMSAVRYTQRLNNLLDDPEAQQQHDPLLVNRLRRLRDRRVGERARRQGLT